MSFIRLVHSLRITAILLSVFVLRCNASAQALLGNSGGLNIPSAEIAEAGTFRGGAQFVKANTIVGAQKWGSYRWAFDTGIYYVSFTPFSWLEATFTETILAEKNKEGIYDYYNQDRTVSVKARLLPEGRWWPALAVGAIDPFSLCDHPTYSSYWAAATKHLHFKALRTSFVFTGGYAKGQEQSQMYDGAFGGFYIKHDALPGSRLCVEYDTNGWVVGAEALIWRHLGLYYFQRLNEGMSFGIRYQTTIH